MIFVTGATGTVGSQVVEELLKLGVPVRAGVHSRPLEIDGVESHKIDFNRPETMAPAFEGVSDLFLASYETWHEQNAVPVAQEAGVQRIVKLSAWRAADKAFIVGRGLSANHPDHSPKRLVEDITAFVDSIGEPVGLVE